MTVAEDGTLKAVVARHQDSVWRAAYRVLGDRDEALDVMQDAFLSWHERPGARAGNAGRWLVRVAVNRALDILRRRERTKRVEAALVEEWSASSPAASMASDSRDRVWGAIESLSPRQAEVVTMRVLDQMKFPDIAAVLGISDGAAKVHFARGMKALRERLVRGDER